MLDEEAKQVEEMMETFCRVDSLFNPLYRRQEEDSQHFVDYVLLAKL